MSEKYNLIIRQYQLFYMKWEIKAWYEGLAILEEVKAKDITRLGLCTLGGSLITWVSNHINRMKIRIKSSFASLLSKHSKDSGKK